MFGGTSEFKTHVNGGICAASISFIHAIMHHANHAVMHPVPSVSQECFKASWGEHKAVHRPTADAWGYCLKRGKVVFMTNNAGDIITYTCTDLYC